jgi:amidase
MMTDFIDKVGAFTPNGRFVIDGAKDGPLTGLTFAAKDLFDIAGHPTGAGNPTWLATHEIPGASSPVVDTLLGAGATLVGKVLTDELAFSLLGDNIHYGAPINANAPERATGGSSNGSVAAVAAKLVDFALGTDTGGSTRVPASYCGVWGLRTTHGSLPATALVPLHPMYDTVTWLAHDADVFARVGAALMPASDYAPTRVLKLDDATAFADDVFSEPMARVLAALERKLGTAAQGVNAAQGEALEDWRAAYATSGAHEGWAVHGAWIKRHNPVFAPAIAGRWKAASEVTDEAAASARAKVAAIREKVRALIGADGVAVLPSAASFAPLRNADPADVDAVRMRTMAMTCIAGISGLPQVNMPFSAPDGTPIGVSLMGPAGSDLALIKLAVEIQRAAQAK